MYVVLAWITTNHVQASKIRSLSSTTWGRQADYPRLDSITLSQLIRSDYDTPLLAHANQLNISFNKSAVLTVTREMLSTYEN